MDVVHPDQVDELKRKILTAWRILHGEKLLDFMGHVSARVSKDSFLITSRMPKYGAVQEDAILTIRSNGEALEGKGLAPIELPLHEIIYGHRPDVMSVIHTHPQHVVALSATGRRLQVLHQMCLPFIEGVPVHEDFSMVDSVPKATRMLKTLSNRRAVLLRHHGAVVTGSTVEEACVLTIWLEKCAEIQLTAGGTRVEGIPKNKEAVRLVEHQLRTTIKAAWKYYDSKHAAASKN